MGIFDRFEKGQKETTAGGSVVHRYSEAAWKKTPFGPPGESAIRFGKQRDEAYQRHFGEAKSVSHEVLPLIPHIDVMEYHRTVELNGADSQICVLVTSGMSDLAMKVPPKADARRIELILYCSEPKQEYIDTMRWLAHFPHDQKAWIGAFHTIPNGNPPRPMWGSDVLDTIFLLPTLVKKDAALHEALILDGDEVHLIWIVPITTAECNLKLAEGSNALLELFSQRKHPYIFNPGRRSYV